MKTKQALPELLKAIQQAKCFGPYSISLYTAMLSCWRQQEYNMPFRVTRNQLMSLSGIRSFATYHKCLSELITREYIHYQPSFDKRIASQITLITSDGSTQKG